MKAYQLNFGTLLLRYYFLMAVVILAGFTGQWWLAGFALPIFLSALLGVKFEKIAKKGVAASGRLVWQRQREALRQAA